MDQRVLEDRQSLQKQKTHFLIRSLVPEAKVLIVRQPKQAKLFLPPVCLNTCNCAICSETTQNDAQSAVQMRDKSR